MDERVPVESGADETRQRIIEAALRLFGEVGFKRATTRAIAAEAGVNEVTLFRHFGNKRNLLATCVERFNEAGFAMNLEKYLTGDYRQDVAIMAQALMDSMEAGFDVLRLLMCEAIEVEALRDVAQAGSRANSALVADYFRRQIEAGVVRADLDPFVLAGALESLFATPVLYRRLFGGDPGADVKDDAVLQQLADLFVQGTIHHR